MVLNLISVMMINFYFHFRLSLYTLNAPTLCISAVTNVIVNQMVMNNQFKFEILLSRMHYFLHLNLVSLHNCLASAGNSEV